MQTKEISKVKKDHLVSILVRTPILGNNAKNLLGASVLYEISHLCVQVHASPQVIKWKYEYHPTSIGLLITEIRIVLSLFRLTQW